MASASSPRCDLGGALLDRHQLVGEVALADQDVALGDARLVRERGDHLQVVVVQVREERDRLQSGLVHGSSASSRFRVSSCGATVPAAALAAHVGPVTHLGWPRAAARDPHARRRLARAHRDAAPRPRRGPHAGLRAAGDEGGASRRSSSPRCARSASTWCSATRSTCSSRPGTSACAEFGGLHEFMRWDAPDHHRLRRLPGLLDGPRDGRRRGQGPRRAGLAATATARGKILAIEEEGVRFRSYLDGTEQFMGPETCMEVQAALGSDIALVFDECTPFHVSRDYTARSTERTHRWLDRCLAVARAARPGGPARLRDRPGRRRTRTCGAGRRRRSPRAATGGIAIGGSLGEDKAADVRGGRVGGRRAARGPAAPPARHRRRRRPDPRRRARHRHLRLRDADPPRPPRDGRRARPGAPAGGSTSARPATRARRSR